MSKECKILAQIIKDQINEFKCQDAKDQSLRCDHEVRLMKAGYFLGVIDCIVTEELKESDFDLWLEDFETKLANH